jgi:hypothetical protein
MNKNLIITLLSVVILGLGYFLLQKPDEKVVKIPVTIEVPIPGKVSTFPPVEMPKPKKEKSRPIADIPDKDKDSILKDALTEREYEEIFEDSITKSTVKSIVKGHLLKQSLITEVKPDTIKIDTVIKYKLPNPKIKVYAGATGGLNLTPLNNKPSLGPTIGIQNKKDNIITVNYDPFNNQINATYLFKLKF